MSHAGPAYSLRNVALAVVATSVFAACTYDAPPEEEHVGAESAAIVNGTPDTTHQAVVAYIHANGKCSATIVAVSGSTGYALTAGHCLGPSLGKLYQGNDHNNPAVTYTVTASTAHPGYPGATLYDFAMLKFSGATAQTPVLPVLPQNLDALKKGSSLDLVGFGKIQDVQNGGDTSLRHHKALPASTTSLLRLYFDQKTGGMCFGDSGGPAVFVSGGTEYVAGVHSGVSNNCTTQGLSVRASAVLDSFVKPFIDGTPYGKETCDECTEAHAGSGKCVNAVTACFDDAGCSAYYDCIVGCSTNACVTACAAGNPAGADKYNLIYACVCDTACVAECGDAPVCNPPACGLTSKKAGCQTCLEASCCAEAKACSESALCGKCLSSAFPPGECADDAATQAVTACLAQSCSSECDVAPPTSSASVSTSAGAGGGDASASVGVGGAGAVTSGAGAEDATSGGGGDDARDPIVVEGSCTVAAHAPPAGAQSRGLAHAAIAVAAMVLAAARRRS